MRSFGATPRFYIERLRSQLVQARGRRYPDAGDVPARWLGLLERRLDGAEALIASDRRSLIETERALLTIAACYAGLQYAERAHTGQVAYYVVGALKRWFDVADPGCAYLFTSGGEYELMPLFDIAREKAEDVLHAAAGAGLDRTVYAVTMPGGALGSAFHIPLVAHEAGHVLAARLEDELVRRLDARLDRADLEFLAEDPSARAIMTDWMTEVFADTVLGHVTGPAGFFALHEKLRESTRFQKDYPPNRLRVQGLRTFVFERFGDVLADNGITAADWEDWSVPGDVTSADVAEDDLVPIADVFLRSFAGIREECAAVVGEAIPELAYTSEALAADLGCHLDDFYHAIPPFETKDAKALPTGLATILNVGWFIAAFRLQDMQIKVPGGEGKVLVVLDDLVSKAIELAEARHAWRAAA